MTKEQYHLLVQYAADFRSALHDYENEYGAVDLQKDPVAEILAAAANLMHVVDSIEPIHSAEDAYTF